MRRMKNVLLASALTLPAVFASSQATAGPTVAVTNQLTVGTGNKAIPIKVYVFAADGVLCGTLDVEGAEQEFLNLSGTNVCAKLLPKVYLITAESMGQTAFAPYAVASSSTSTTTIESLTVAPTATAVISATGLITPNTISAITPAVAFH